jgi:hypothetical protein
LIVVSRCSWPEGFDGTCFVPVVVVVVFRIATFAMLVVLIIVAILVSCGYLVVRAIVLQTLRSAPLVAVAMGPVIFW